MSNAKVEYSSKVVPTFEITDANLLVVLKKLCTFLADHEVVSANRQPVSTRYPQFIGIEKASIRAAVLDEFIESKAVLVSPGVAVLSDTVLSQRKMLVSPTPGLRGQKVLQRLVKNDQEAGEGKRQQKFKRSELNEDVKIDMLVVGSMLVDKNGRRIGKKWDQVGMEFVLGGLGAQNLVVISLVHDCQVVEEIPESFFSEMDVPVDIIVTPTRVIRVKDRLPKPRDILWNRITEGMIEDIPVLKAAWNKAKEGGKVVDLASNSLGGWKRGNTKRGGDGDLVMGSKIKMLSLPRELKYSELREALKEKVEPGFKVGVLKFGMAVVYFKETSEVVMKKVKDLKVKDKQVDIEKLEFVVKEPRNSDDLEGKGLDSSEKKGKDKKVEMKSKFKFENISSDIKSTDLKKALIACGLHFGFLKIFRKSNMAVGLFQEDGSEVEQKLRGITIGKQKLVINEVELGEKKQEKVTSNNDVKNARKADKLQRLKEMKSKYKFRNLGHLKVSKLKESLRECKVEPGFMVVYKKFGNAIVLFKEVSSDVEKKLKGFKVEDIKVDFEDVGLVSKRITRSKSLSEGDKKETNQRTGYRKRTVSQKYYEKGLSGIFIGSLPRGVTAKEVKEAVGKKEVDAAHVELIGRKGIAFAYFDKPEYEVLLDKLKDLKVKERNCKVEVMRSPPRNSRPPVISGKLPKIDGIVAKEESLKGEASSTSPKHVSSKGDVAKVEKTPEKKKVTKKTSRGTT